MSSCRKNVFLLHSIARIAMILCIAFLPGRVCAIVFEGSYEIKTTFENPDFAFPETVEKDAHEVLVHALSDCDGLRAVRALMEIVVARNSVDRFDFVENSNLVDSVARLLEAPYSNLAYLLEGVMYSELYSSDKWKFNSRKLPGDLVPESPFEWDGTMFADKAVSLIRQAVDMPEAKGKMLLNEVGEIVSLPDKSMGAFLTVYDFVAANAIRILRDFAIGNSTSVIPFYGLTSDTSDPRVVCSDMALRIYGTMLEKAEKSGNGARTVFALLQSPVDMKTNELTVWAEKLKGCREDAFLLQKISEGIDFATGFNSNASFPNNQASKLKSLCGEWRRRFGGSKYWGMVKAIEGRLEQPEMFVKVPSALLPNKPFEAELSVRNMKKGYLLVYRVPSSMISMNQLIVKKFPKDTVLVKSVPVTFGAKKMEPEYKKIRVGGLTPGYYVVVPSATGSFPSDWKNNGGSGSLCLVRVSDITLLKSSSRTQEGSGLSYVVKGINQKPVKGATVAFYKDGNLKNPYKTGKTGPDGSVVMPEGNFRVKAAYGGSEVWDWEDFQFREEKTNSGRTVRIWTDMSIYRPGDSVGFAAVAMDWKDNRNVLLEGGKMHIVMQDANYNAVDTVSVTTDVWGRCNGKMKIPSAGLLGNYSLYAVFGDKPRQKLGTVYIKVAEYKVPGFYVELKKNASEPNGKYIEIDGKAETYSGMPVEGNVRFTVEWTPFFRVRSEVRHASYSGTAECSPEGCFKISLPTEKLKGTCFMEGVFEIKADVTSASGETVVSKPLRFTIGSEYSLAPRIDGKIKVEGESVLLHVGVNDALGMPVVKEVEYKVKDLSKGMVILSGEFESPLLRLPSSELPSGEYSFEFAIPGAEDESSPLARFDAEASVYRDGDTRPPCSAIVWMPEEKKVVPQGAGSVKVKVGSSYKGSWLFCQVSSWDRIVSRRFVCVSDSIVDIDVEVPIAGERLWLTVCGMHDLKREVRRTELVPDSMERKMKVEISSFRDRINAGEREHWKFRFAVGDSPAGNIPVMAVMTDKAMNALSRFAWDFNISPYDSRSWTRAGVSGMESYPHTGHAWFKRIPNHKVYVMEMPVLDEWSLSFAGMSMPRAMVKMMATGSYNGQVVEMAMDTRQSDSYNSVMMKSAATDDEAKVEDVAEDSGSFVVRGAGKSQDEEALRPVEMPIAFFKPDLATDRNGIAEISIEVPNFNTTWQLQVGGYDRNLYSGGLTVDAIASKPVMVGTNLPVFLRTGDEAEITALIFNNSDSTLLINGKIEVADIFTGKVYGIFESEEVELHPSRSAPVTVRFTVPDNAGSLIVRAYASSGLFHDGEQGLVAVVPASELVVEGSPFYISEGKKEVSFKLPKIKGDANVSLRYCTSPVMEAALSLPELYKSDSRDVLTLMQSLYASAEALKIASDCPYIEHLLREALREPDSLKSGLEKGSPYKIVDLASTPWVNDARSETERMRNLGYLLDAGNTLESLSSILEKVKKLQNADGGWSWCPGMESSMFITRRVLGMWARIKETGTLPEDSPSMIAKALAYADKKTLEEWENNGRRFSTPVLMHYFRARDLLSGDVAPEIAELRSAVIDSVASGWKELGVADRAVAALFLKSVSASESSVEAIMESLRQMAVKSAVYGWHYETDRPLVSTASVLGAFAAVAPSDEAVDCLRQWILLQKETVDWGRDKGDVSVIGALLSCGTEWRGDEFAPVIFIGRDRYELQTPGAYSAVATLTLDPVKVSGKKMTIKRDGNSPAWGGVLVQYVAPSAEVTAVASDNISIRKDISVYDESGNLKEAAPGGYKEGDKVRITLTIECGKEMDYVVVADERAGCLVPETYISGYGCEDGLWCYKEVGKTKTSFFISRLKKGSTVLSYDCFVGRNGEYSLGTATVQSLYSPAQTAHSSGGVVSSGM